MSETLSQEFSRLVGEYNDDEAGDATKAEAWNYIADFAVDHSHEIASALAALATPEAGTSEPVADPFGCVDKWQQNFASAKTHAIGTLIAKGWTPLYTHPAPAQAPVDGEAVRAQWQTMDTAPRDGSQFLAIEVWYGGMHARIYRWVGEPNCWLALNGQVCIRPEYQQRFHWISLPATPIDGGKG